MRKLFVLLFVVILVVGLFYFCEKEEGVELIIKFIFKDFILEKGGFIGMLFFIGCLEGDFNFIFCLSFYVE